MAIELLTASTSELAAASASLRELLDALDDAFGCEFHVVDVESGSPIHFVPGMPRCEAFCSREMLSAAARTSLPQWLAEEGPLAVLALPLARVGSLPWVAYAPFKIGTAESPSPMQGAALLGQSESSAHEWIACQSPWSAHALERLGREFLRRLSAQQKATKLEREIDQVLGNLASSYEEISLLHSISQNFRLSSSDEELGQQAIEWLSECLPAQNLTLVYLPVAKKNDTTYQARTEPLMLAVGDSFFNSAEELFSLVEQFCGCSSLLAKPGQAASRPCVVNRSQMPGAVPEPLRQLIIAPLVEGERVLGYLVACNHENDEEFGTVEANLLASVTAMLGVHCSNRDLYRQQDEFLASVVRALTSAIDAKDPYTCGHSDRVARVATRLAQELGCDNDFLATIYMAGLLHDVGKIGIEDAVLRKPGRLTDSEFEHIKQHPALGYKILSDIKQFSNVLPAVLHHHEQWDGKGYPCQLGGEQIPFMARIVAVADAYDAMTSDRPYRAGMPEEKVRSIFEKGAGEQWDAEVVAAFFSSYNDLRAISQHENSGLSLDIRQWLVQPQASKLHGGEDSLSASWACSR